MSGQISEISVQKKRRDRFSVFIDNEYAFALHRDVLLECGIAKGDCLDEQQIKDILQLENLHKAKEQAMRLLAVRPRSRKELGDRLQQKYSKEIAEQVLARLQEIGLLNDAEFAIMYARSRLITHPQGSWLIKRELAQKGVAEDYIDTATNAAFAEKSEKEWAVDLAKKKMRTYRNIEEIKAKQRVRDFLIRRGFQWPLVIDILDHWDDINENDTGIETK